MGDESGHGHGHGHGHVETTIGSFFALSPCRGAIVRYGTRMNRGLLVCLPVSVTLAMALAACGAAGTGAVGVTTPSAAVITPVAKTEEPSTSKSLDPLAIDGAFEAAAVPNVVQTPGKQLRPKSRGDLDSAMALLKNESTPEGALKKVTARLGKPTWIENGKKRVWIAKDGKSCHRFVLDTDGQADVETAPTTDWRMLSALAQQNACSGEIRRGGLGSP